MQISLFDSHDTQSSQSRIKRHQTQVYKDTIPCNRQSQTGGKGHNDLNTTKQPHTINNIQAPPTGHKPV